MESAFNFDNTPFDSNQNIFINVLDFDECNLKDDNIINNLNKNSEKNIYLNDKSLT